MNKVIEVFLRVTMVSGMWLPYGLIFFGKQDTDASFLGVMSLFGAVLNFAFIIIGVLIYLWATGIK